MTKSSSGSSVAHDAGALAGAVVLRPPAAVDRLPVLPSEPGAFADRAREQHAVLVRTLQDRGAGVTVLAPSLDTPHEVLVADCALVLPDGAILTRPSQPDRRAELAAVERALETLGIPVLARIEAPGLLDASDVALGGEIAVVGVPRHGAGLRPRSNELGRRQLEAILGRANVRVVEVALAPDVLRLRQVFNFVGRTTVVAAPERVDLVPVSQLTAIEVPRGEELGANVLAFGERRVIANLRFRDAIGALRAAKVEVEAIDLYEFAKAGYGPAQLVLATKRG